MKGERGMQQLKQQHQFNTTGTAKKKKDIEFLNNRVSSLMGI
jgi:hypothetical protein